MDGLACRFAALSPGAMGALLLVVYASSPSPRPLFPDGLCRALAWTACPRHLHLECTNPDAFIRVGDESAD